MNYNYYFFGGGLSLTQQLITWADTAFISLYQRTPWFKHDIGFTIQSVSRFCSDLNYRRQFLNGFVPTTFRCNANAVKCLIEWDGYLTIKQFQL